MAEIYRKSWNKTLPCLIVLLCHPLLAQAGIAGRIQFVAGDVRIIGLDGKERAAIKGAEVQELESLITGNLAQAQLRMVDGALLALRPDTQIKLEAYEFHENGTQEKAWLSLLKGGLRSLTGLIGKRNKENYAIRTPNAVIGIRGTDHEPVVILPGTVIAQNNLPGTYDKVNVGMTSLTTQAGTTLIGRNQIGFAGAANQPPSLLPQLPSFYKTEAQPKIQAKRSGEASEATEASGNTLAATTPRQQDDKQLALIGENGGILPVSSNQTSFAADNATNVRTAVDENGAVLNSSSQTLANLNGTLTPIGSAANPESTPRLDFSASFSKSAQYSPSELSSFDSSNQQLKQSLSTLSLILQANTDAQNSVTSAAQGANQSLIGAQKSNQAATSAGIIETHPVLLASAQAMDVARTSLLQTQRALSGVNNNGLLATQQLADQGLQIFNRYQSNVTKWQNSNDQASRLALALDEQASIDWVQRWAQQTNLDLASSSQAALAQANHAVELAQVSLQELTKMSPSDPQYALLKQAAEEVQLGVFQALKAAQTLQSTLHQTEQSLLAVANLAQLALPSSANAQPTLGGISNGSYAATISLNRDAAGNLTSASAMQQAASGNTKNALYFDPANKPQLLNLFSDSRTGLTWGRWQGGQVITEEMYTDRDESGRVGLGAIEAASGKFVIGASQKHISNQEQASLHWISGQEASPQRLPQILTGSASYTLLGGTAPTDSQGRLGQLNSAQLHANFSQQSVSALISFSFGNDQWQIGDSQLTLAGSRFEGQTCNYCPAQGSPGSLATFKKNGTQINPNQPTGPNAEASQYQANLSGSLMGLGLTSAGLQYAVAEPIFTNLTDPITGNNYQIGSVNLMQGVVGFSGEKQNVNTMYRAVTLDDGSLVYNSLAGINAQPSVSASIDYGSPASRLLDNASGMQEMIGTASGYTTFDNRPAPEVETAVTIKRGSASNTNLGSASFGNTTVRWGRWENGVVDIYSRDGGTKLGSINNQGRSLHWINTSASSDKMASLPITGSATYNLEGATAPTDLKGNQGTLNSAKVDVDFSAMRANTSFNLSFNTSENFSNWNVEVKNTPIIRGDIGFNTTSNNHGVNGESHVAQCTGSSCGGQNFSNVSAFFIGVNAPGLGFAYDLVSGDKKGAQFTPRANAHGVVILRK